MLHAVYRHFITRHFNHPTLNHDRVRDETLNHVKVKAKIRVGVINSSPLVLSSCYKVYVIRCLVIKCR